jgi:hypothetical protein
MLMESPGVISGAVGRSPPASFAFEEVGPEGDGCGERDASLAVVEGM